jgi:hypothetical protein
MVITRTHGMSLSRDIALSMPVATTWFYLPNVLGVSQRESGKRTQRDRARDKSTLADSGTGRPRPQEFFSVPMRWECETDAIHIPVALIGTPDPLSASWEKVENWTGERILRKGGCSPSIRQCFFECALHHRLAFRRRDRE